LFCAPGFFFGGTEVVGTSFHVLRARTHFRRYRGRCLPFSCFARSDSFSAVTRAFGPVFMCCAPRLIFDGTECVGSRFHVLLAPTCFRRYRGRQVLFSCFVLSDMFSGVPSASGPVFMFCEQVLVIGGTVGVRTRFHVLRSRTRFRRYRGRRLPFSCISRSDSFSAVARGSGLVFTFCTPRLNFGRTVGIGSCFHVLRSRTRYRRFGVRQVPFSRFARPDSFSAVPKALDPVLRARTYFRWYRGHRVPFSCFALPNMFSTVRRASGPVFMFCAPGLIFGRNKGVGSRFQVLRS
jgi:hypothetical protein